VTSSPTQPMISTDFVWLLAVLTRGENVRKTRDFVSYSSPRIKIWQLDEGNGSWNVEDDWKVRIHISMLLMDHNSVCIQAHDAAVSRVCWAHPEFGSIIASSSFDRTVKIWEQTPMGAQENPQPINANGTQPVSSVLSSRWVERAVLLDARGTVRSVEFAPHHFGLKFVCQGIYLFAKISKLTAGRRRYPQIITYAYTNVSNSPLSPLGNYLKK
jgi:WD40 repeat protein